MFANALSPRRGFVVRVGRFPWVYADGEGLRPLRGREPELWHAAAADRGWDAACAGGEDGGGVAGLGEGVEVVGVGRVGAVGEGVEEGGFVEVVGCAGDEMVDLVGGAWEGEGDGGGG